MSDTKQPDTKQPESLGAEIAKGLAEGLKNQNKKPELPKGGPVPTDETGTVKKPDAVFFERDGKEYPCVIERERNVTITLRSGDNAYKDVVRTVYDVRVNFKRKDIDNWVAVSGVSAGDVVVGTRSGGIKRRIKILKGK